MAVAYRYRCCNLSQNALRGSQISTPYNIDEVDPNGARFRSTSHNDAAFVGQVSE
jgi:RNA-directed DNA polymerase